VGRSGPRAPAPSEALWKLAGGLAAVKMQGFAPSNRKLEMPGDDGRKRGVPKLYAAVESS